MPNLIKELKAEIVRLTRKEIKGELAPAKRVTVAQRGLIAGLRRQVISMKNELAILKKAVPAPASAVLGKGELQGRFWITGKGVKALRKRLGLTQDLFAKLAGVSVPSVVIWEKNKGKLGLRKATAGKLQGIRGLKKRQAAEILGKSRKRKAKAAKAKVKGKAQKV